MANADVIEAFRYATEDLSDVIHEQAMAQSIWLNMVKRGVCKLGAGTRFVNFGIGNTEPIGTVGAWKTIGLSRRYTGAAEQSGDVTDEDVFATNAYHNVSFGGTELAYQPEYWEMRGPEVSVRQLMFSHNKGQFMRNYVKRLTDRAKREWEMNYQLNTVKLSRQAVATGKYSSSWNSAANTSVTVGAYGTAGDPATFAGASLTPDQATYAQQLKIGGTTPIKKATSLLTHQMLEFAARDLIDVGAHMPDEHGFMSLGEMGPQFSMMIDPILSANLLRLNKELRRDYQQGDPQSLLNRIGATLVTGSFRHLPWLNEMRFAYTETGTDGDGDSVGTYAMIDRWVPAGTTNAYGAISGTVIGDGVYAAQNKKWRDASYGCVIIPNTELWTSEIIPFSGGEGLEVPPQNWMGDFKFVDGAYKFGSVNTTDPLGQRGAHFAQLGHAPSPNPVAAYNYGWIIFYDRTKISGAAADEVTTIS